MQYKATDGSGTIAVVIPALNEEGRISDVLHDLRRHAYSNLIVVDDGSRDRTGELARRHARVLRHAVSRGYGAALQTGTLFALRNGAQVIVHFDGDGQHRADEVRRLVDPIVRGEADIVVGSRYLDSNHATPITKKYLIHLPALLVQRITTGLRFTDVHNGFRALSRSAAQRLSMHQSGMAYSSEIVSQIRKLKLRYREVPVTIAYREYGQGFLDGLRIYRDLIVRWLLK